MIQQTHILGENVDTTRAVLATVRPKVTTADEAGSTQ